MSKIKSQYLQRYRLLRPEKKGRLPQFTQVVQSISQRTDQQIKGKVQYQLQTNKYGTKRRTQRLKQKICQQLIKRQRNQTQRASQNMHVAERKISRLICQGIIPNLKYNQTKIDPQKKQKSLSNKRKQRQKSAVSRFNRQQEISESLKLSKLNQNTNQIHQAIKNVSTMSINLPNVPRQRESFLPNLKFISRQCLASHQKDKQNYSGVFDEKIKYRKKKVYNKIHHIITMGRNQSSIFQKQRTIPYTTRAS